MADENRNGIPDHVESLAVVFEIFIVIAVISAFLGNASGIFDKIHIGGQSITDTWKIFSEQYLPLIRIISVSLSLALIVFIIYISIEIDKVLAKIKETIEDDKTKYTIPKFGTEEKSQEAEKSQLENVRWQKVVKLINSSEQSDWKLAILESDIMLGELLDALGYKGESMGEQLKKIEKSDFTTLDSAWEAHKIRNSIAHEGEFLITQREAARVIRLYEEVFLEFRYI
ncbi:MAG: hypothetical protein MRY49_01430 [Candidatus Pacebacteria bacterium]|nr:hypothetical protein [Candidatus Paceibacterota bacterium]